MFLPPGHINTSSVTEKIVQEQWLLFGFYINEQRFFFHKNDMFV